MKIFKDIVTGDEMLSDTFQMTLEYEDAIIKVPSKNRPKDDLGNVDVGCGDAFGKPEGEDEAPAQEGVEMVLDVVANSELKQVNMSKKEFMAYIKDYFKKVIAYLEENGKSDRVEGFKKGAQAFIKFIVPWEGLLPEPPGTANISRFCSPANLAVINEPLLALASITSVAMHIPDIILFLIGKYQGSGATPGAYSETIAPVFKSFSLVLAFERG